MKRIRNRKSADRRRMRKEYPVIIEKTEYSVLFSDEREALLAAKAAKRAVLGLWDEKNPENIPAEIPYLVEDEAQITKELLERLVLRRLRLPWNIAETKRLRIREFMPEDWTEVVSLFDSEEAFISYIAHQYPFYEYGLWAVVEKEQGRLIGGCGIWDGDKGETETGYWISPAFRRRGYAAEAVSAVLDYAAGLGKMPVYAEIREENIPSRKLAEKLHFQLTEYGHEKVSTENLSECMQDCASFPQGQSEARKLRYRFVPYC